MPVVIKPAASGGDVTIIDDEGVEWGAIAGTLSAQTDLQAALDAKQASGSYAAALHGHEIGDVTGLQTALDGKASTSQTTEQISCFPIPAVTDRSYKLAIKMAHGGTITETTTESASGTCTATFKINSTALGGTANSVSSSRQSQAHSSSNTFVAGDDIVLTVSSNSSCTDMSFTIKYTRVLA